VRFVGEPIASVFAPTVAEAEDMADRVEIEIAESPARQYPDGDARRLLPPTAREIPAIELHHIETPAASSLTGAKGLGEGGTIGAPAAILNAVNDALSPFGISIDEMPATPQRIRAALRSGITNRQLVIRYQ